MLTFVSLSDSGPKILTTTPEAGMIVEWRENQ
jgi:hypothetical protein